MYNLIWLFILSMLNIGLHEFAHAIMCKLFNKTILKIQIGNGLSIKLKKVKIGCIPLSGGVHFQYDAISKIEKLWIYLSGPFITLVLLIIYWNFFKFEYKEILIIQLILHLTISILPIEGSDLSNAIMLNRKKKL